MKRNVHLVQFVLLMDARADELITLVAEDQLQIANARIFNPTQEIETAPNAPTSTITLLCSFARRKKCVVLILVEAI